MNHAHSAQRLIGSTVIAGHAIDFVWAPQTRFVTAQFAARSPRGLANLDRLDSPRPVVVPLGHRDWFADTANIAALIEAGRNCFVKVHREGDTGETQAGRACFGSATDEPSTDANRGSPTRHRAGARGEDRNCGTVFRLVNGRGSRARTR